jgi:hypothetical protein
LQGTNKDISSTAYPQSGVDGLGTVLGEPTSYRLALERAAKLA